MDLGRRALTRNTAYNLLGQGLPLLVALVAVPLLLQGLGLARFGLLGLVWMFVALFGDVGFGRSGTRFAARALGAGRLDEARQVLRTTLLAQGALGLAIGGVLAVSTPWLVERVLGVAPDLRREAIGSFLLLAATVPAMSVAGAYRGILEAAQRFGILNGVRFTVSALNYLLPLAALAAGMGLVGVVALLLGLRVLMAVALGMAVRRVLARWDAAEGGPVPAATPGAILTFGAWVTLSTLVSPVLMYLDRFLLGALVGVDAVGVYTAPFEVVTRLLLIPGSLAAAFFPAVSALDGMGRGSELGRATARSTAVSLALVAPLAVGVAWAAGPLLTVWLGSAATPESVALVRILAVGVLANAVALIPFSLLQGLGRADITARFHLMELPLHAVLAWLFIGRWGVAGAAAAWTVRVVLDAALLSAAAWFVLRRRAA